MGVDFFFCALSCSCSGRHIQFIQIHYVQIWKNTLISVVSSYKMLDSQSTVTYAITNIALLNNVFFNSSASNNYFPRSPRTVFLIWVSDLQTALIQRLSQSPNMLNTSRSCTLSSSSVTTSLHFSSCCRCDESLRSFLGARSRILVYMFADMRTWCMCSWFTFIYVFLITDSCCNCRHLIWGTFIQKRCQSFLFQGIHIFSVFYVFIFVLMIQMIGRVVHCKSNGEQHTKSSFVFCFCSFEIDSNC